MLNKKNVVFVLSGLTIVVCEHFGLIGMGLNKPQEIAIGIFIIAATLWLSDAVPLFLVSFLILALELIWLAPALERQGTLFSYDIFYQPFFSNIILLFIGGFVLSALMQKHRLDQHLAQTILKKTKGAAHTTLLGIIVICAFLSMWISNTATTAMMLAIVYPLLAGIPEGHRFKVGLVLSIPFACNIGGIGTPIGTPPNAIALSYLSKEGYELSFAQWMGLMLPFVILSLAILWGLLLKLYPANNLQLHIETKKTDKLTPTQQMAAAIVILTALGWLSCSYLDLQTGTIALLPIIASFWLGLLASNDFQKLPWDVIYIISGGLCLGVAIEASGLDLVLVDALPSETPQMLLMVVLVFSAALMSTVMSNTATAGLIIPLAVSLNIDNHLMLTLVFSLTMMCSMAMALPITTPPNAIAFSSRAVNSKQMMLAGSIITVIGFLMICVYVPLYKQHILPHLGL